jgi:hypothetical protein
LDRIPFAAVENEDMTSDEKLKKLAGIERTMAVVKEHIDWLETRNDSEEGIVHWEGHLVRWDQQLELMLEGDNKNVSTSVS